MLIPPVPVPINIHPKNDQHIFIHFLLLHGKYMRNCDELPTAIVTLLPLVLLLASLENKVFQYGIYR
jgi:hypothetical protein